MTRHDTAATPQSTIPDSTPSPTPLLSPTFTPEQVNEVVSLVLAAERRGQARSSISAPTSHPVLRRATLDAVADDWIPEALRKHRQERQARLSRSIQSHKAHSLPRFSHPSTSPATPAPEPHVISKRSRTSQKLHMPFLTAQGHLTDEERLRRLGHGLCLVCGRDGHRACDCPRSRARQSQSHTASIRNDSEDIAESEQAASSRRQCCVIPEHAHTTEAATVKLNALSSPNSTTIRLSSGHSSFAALIDSGSTHSFMDTRFAKQQGFPVCKLPQPLRLTLFDGSSVS